ncbi:MAG: COG4648 family protein [Halothiobacillus sp.]
MIRSELIGRIKGLLILLLLGLDVLLANFLSPKAEISGAMVALAFLPITLITLDVLWRTFGKYMALLAMALIIGGALMLLPQLQTQISLIYLLQHVTANLLLGFWFGQSLRQNRESVCTRFAGVLHPHMNPLLVRYTTRVTQAWTAFFFIMAFTSMLLYLFAPILVWSVFANTLTLPFLVLMFGVEYLVRRRVLPPEDQLGPMSACRAYRRAALARRQPVTHPEP